MKRSTESLINECRNLRCFKQIHAHLITSGSEIDNLVVNKAIEIFKVSHHHHHHLDYASDFLLNNCNTTPTTPTSSFPFNSLMAAYASSKTPESAILIYKKLVRGGGEGFSFPFPFPFPFSFSPDMYTFPVILKSCVKLSRTGEGRQFHGVVIKLGLYFDLYVQNAFLHLYSGCGQFYDANKLFEEMPIRDVVSWTSFISGCVKANFFTQALFLFSKMDVDPNPATVVSALVACGRMGDHGMGRGIHSLIFKCGFGVSVVVGNALVDMYVKCMCLGEAKQLFYELPERDAISWTCIISGLVQCKQPKEALEFFHDMQASGMDPDKVTLASVLSACSSLDAIDYGKWVHEYIDRKGIERDPHIGTALVDMYAKCGDIEMAYCTFHEMPRKNIFTWNALLGGLAMHGNGKEALDHFREMLKVGIIPNEVTFLAVLTACCHSGLVDEGRWLFNEVGHAYDLQPRIEHYGCMVDLLCKAGLLSEANDLVKSMPMAPDVLIWGALLSACKAYGNVEMSRNILDHLLELESTDCGVFVLLSNIFASNDRWEDVTRVRKLMKNKGIKKFPGSSVIEVGRKITTF